MVELRPFDPANYLTDDEKIAGYLSAVLVDGDADEFIGAVGDAARAKRMASVAEASGLSRESLYKALKPGAQVRFSTILKVLDALGMRLTVVPKAAVDGAELSAAE